MINFSIKHILSALLSKKRRKPVEPAIGTLLRWSDPANWPGGKPVAGQPLTLSGNWLLDEQTPPLGPVSITGYLRDDPAAPNIGITADSIVVTPTGTLRIGEETARRGYKTIITLTGAESGRVNRYVADRTLTSGTGNGRLTRLAASTGAVAETITVTFTSPTAFSVAGSASGPLGTGQVGQLFNNKIRFIAVAGSTPWVAGATSTVRVQKQAFRNNALSRSLQREPGGQLKLFGRIKTSRSRLKEAMADGATSCKVEDATGWEVGDEIVVGPSDFPDTASGTPVKRTLTGVSGNLSTGFTLTWADPVSGSRWGALQYATDTGLSLTPGTLTKPSDWTQQEWDDTPKVLDERAVIVNLTHDIVIQGADDAAWQNNGFGAHTMYMGLDEGVEIDGVEFRRVGQAGAIGCYPVHWHIVSYNMPDGMFVPSDGTFIGLASGHYIRNCSIHNSSQRAVVLHGSCGIRVENNVCYDIRGHAIFFEEASEMHNHIIGNTIIKVTKPLAANRLNESEEAPTAGSSGIWLTNPSNHVIGNWCFNAPVGIWNAFPERCYNLTQEVSLTVTPKLSRVATHADNIGACCTVRGMFTEQPPIDNLGTSDKVMFFAGFQENGIRFEFRGNQIWKNMNTGYGNRVNAPGHYVGWTAADNETLDFSGQADHDAILRSPLCVGVSLNNGNNAEQRAVNTRRACFVSYDEGLVVRNLLAYNYTLREPPTLTLNSFNGQAGGIAGGGLVRMGEYIFPVWTFTEYGRWKLINCNPGFMCTPPHASGLATGKNTAHSLGICRDVNGLFTGVPGRHVVWNDPFYTYGAANLGPYTHNRAQVTDTVYMGLKGSLASGISNNQYAYLGPFYVDRLDPTGTNVVGSWNVPDSRAESQNLDHFKHCAVARGGVYRLHFNGSMPSAATGGHTYVALLLSMMQSPDDMYTLCVDWPGNVPVGTVYQRWDSDGPTSSATAYEFNNSNGTPLRPYAKRLNNTDMTSRTTVINDTSGLKYWQDTANNRVWIKVKGDLVYDDKEIFPVTGKLQPSRTICLAIRSNVLPS